RVASCGAVSPSLMRTFSTPKMTPLRFAIAGRLLLCGLLDGLHQPGNVLLTVRPCPHLPENNPLDGLERVGGLAGLRNGTLNDRIQFLAPRRCRNVNDPVAFPLHVIDEAARPFPPNPDQRPFVLPCEADGMRRAAR